MTIGMNESTRALMVVLSKIHRKTRTSYVSQLQPGEGSEGREVLWWKGNDAIGVFVKLPSRT